MKEKSINFVVFVVDQMSAFSLGCNGNPDVKTPNLDRLAAEGTTFRRAYCNNPVCMPSRASIITGLTPRQHGLLTNGNKLPEEIPTVVQALNRHGYDTHAIGKLHLQPFGLVQSSQDDFESREHKQKWMDKEINSLPNDYYGFHTSELIGGHVDGCFGDYVNWLEETHPQTHKLYKAAHAYYNNPEAPGSWRTEIPSGLHYNTWIADRSLAYLNQAAQSETPFFLWCSFPDPHFPFVSCKPYSEMYDPNTVSLHPTWNDQEDTLELLRARRAPYKHFSHFTEEGLREVVAQTYGMITHVDENIGRVLEWLDQSTLADNTAVIFISDHGEYLGTHHLLGKDIWMFEELLRVPMIWRVPNSAHRGAVNESVVSLLDLAPTWLDFANIHDTELDTRGVRNGDPAGLPGRSLLPHLMQGKPLESKAALIEYDEDWHNGPMYRIRSIVFEQYKLVLYPVAEGGLLYDLKEDPDERCNRYDEPDYQSIKTLLLEKLAFETARTDRLDQPRLCGA